MIERWPTCAECTSRRKMWVPVEAYGIEEVPARSIACKHDIIVTAECQHTACLQPHERKKKYVATARIEVPWRWGDAHELDAIQSLVFFAAGIASPDHGLD